MTNISIPLEEWKDLIERIKRIEERLKRLAKKDTSQST